MGLYIDFPHSVARESALDTWIEDHCIVAGRIEWESVPEDMLLVCRVWNGSAFSALGVAYSPNEFERFRRGMDGRRHYWYLATKANVRARCPDLDRWIEDAD